MKISVEINAEQWKFVEDLAYDLDLTFDDALREVIDIARMHKIVKGSKGD